MPWNWEMPNWPNFQYDLSKLAGQERRFLLDLGSAFALRKSIPQADYNHFLVEILSLEGVESAKIEGELLQRESLQSSIKRHFGLKANPRKMGPREAGMAELLCDVYDNFKEPLTHEMLWRWHAMLFKGDLRLTDRGAYRTHTEPMQIVSSRLDLTKVYFEAPPSKRVKREMEQFIHWFNADLSSEPILGKAAIAHVYFESIHPFEDGNGRIGRALVEKLLSQAAGAPILMSTSQVIEARKKAYYLALGACNRSLDADQWVCFFAEVLLEAQQRAKQFLAFLIAKTALFTRLSDAINTRQEKVLHKLFDAGPAGFVGGLSAEKYIAMTNCSRATATRDLNELLDYGALTKTGHLRHTRYWLNI